MLSANTVCYSATLKGGFLGGSLGLVLATAGVYAGTLRFPVVRHLTVPMKAFLVTSGTTFGGMYHICGRRGRVQRCQLTPS